MTRIEFEVGLSRFKQAEYLFLFPRCEGHGLREFPLQQEHSPVFAHRFIRGFSKAASPGSPFGLHPPGALTPRFVVARGSHRVVLASDDMTRRKDDGISVPCGDDKARADRTLAPCFASHNSRCLNSSVLSRRLGKAAIVPIVSKDISMNPGYFGSLGSKAQRTEQEEHKTRPYARAFELATPNGSVTPMGSPDCTAMLQHHPGGDIMTHAAKIPEVVGACWGSGVFEPYPEPLERREIWQRRTMMSCGASCWRVGGFPQVPIRPRRIPVSPE